MIEAGCKPDTPDKNGRTPLHIAAGNANVDLCRYLVDLKANIDAGYRSDNVSVNLSRINVNIYI